MPIELQSVRALCDASYGIGRIGDAEVRKRLYQRLIDVAPGERIPWHRLLRELLDEEGLDEAEYAIRNAQDAVGVDGPIDRYKVRLLVLRARKTGGISDGDRVAILRRAYEQALINVDRHPWDKYSYRGLCDVAVELIKRGESEFMLDEAIGRMRDASERILDPDMMQHLRHYESLRSKLR